MELNDEQNLTKRKKHQESEEERKDRIKKPKNKGELKISESEKESNNDENSAEDNKDNSEEDDEDNSEENEDANSEELLISNLLRKALAIIRKTIKVQDEEVRTAGFEIRENFKVYQFTKVDFNCFENLIAYFYAFSLLNVTLSRDRFLHAFKDCRQLQKTIEKENVNIISLGGGPGTDMIGFCSALHDYCIDSLEKFNISVVDKWKRWASFYNVLEFLIREGNYGKVSSIFKSKVISSSFMEVDLLSEVQPIKYERDLKAADIVLLVRVLDSFDYKEIRPGEVIQKIVSGMKAGALLLLIDSNSNTLDYIDPQVVIQVYRPHLEEYSLSIQQRRLFNLYPSTTSKAGISILLKEV